MSEEVVHLVKIELPDENDNGVIRKRTLERIKINGVIYKRIVYNPPKEGETNENLIE